MSTKDEMKPNSDSRKRQRESQDSETFLRDESLLCQGLALNNDFQHVLAKHISDSSGGISPKPACAQALVPLDASKQADQWCLAKSKLNGPVPDPTGMNILKYVFPKLEEHIDDLHAMAPKQLLEKGHSCGINELLTRLCADNNTEPELTHGSRVIAGAFKKNIMMAGDTRVVKINPQNRGELVIDSDSKSKIFSYRRILLAYVGSEKLWKDACKMIKETWGDAVPNIQMLREIYVKLKKIPLGVDNQGIEIVLGYHKDAKPKILLLVYNTPFEGEAEEIDRPEGVWKIKLDDSQGTFIALGSGFRETECYLKEECKKDQSLNEMSWTLAFGVLFSALSVESVGGNLEGARIGPKGIPSTGSTSILEVYVDKFALIKGEDSVILTFRLFDDKDTLTSSEIFKHVYGAAGHKCQYLGAMALKKDKDKDEALLVNKVAQRKGKTLLANKVRGRKEKTLLDNRVAPRKEKALLVNRVVFPSAARASERLARLRIDAHVPQIPLLQGEGLTCIKIGTRSVYLGSPNDKLFASLKASYEFIPSETMSN